MACGITVVVNQTPPRAEISVNGNPRRTTEVSTKYSIIHQEVTNNIFVSQLNYKNITPLISGQSDYAILFESPFTGVNPTIAGSVVDNNGGSIDHYAFTIYNLNTTGFCVEFSAPIQSNDLLFHSITL